MNLRQAYHETTAQFLAGNAMIWISPPGLGKSDTVAKLKAWMRKTFPGLRLGFSVIFMATQSPIGFSGLPWKGALEFNGKTYTITDPAIPVWYIAYDLETGLPAPADQFDRVLLVIEEWGQGDLETKRAGSDLMLHGACGTFRLPPGSFRLALSNNDVRDGVTKEFDFNINRRGELPIVGDADVWVEDFANHPQFDGQRTWTVMPVTKTWGLRNAQIMFEPKPEKQGPWCTPRSLTMWDRYAQVKAEQNDGVIPLDDPAFIESTQGLIGAAAAQSLLATCQFVTQLPDMADVIKDPTGTPVPVPPDLVMLMAFELASRVKPEDIGPVIQYVGRFKQQDMHIAFVSALLRRSYKTFIHLPAMQAWVNKNKQMVAAIGAAS